MSSNARFVADVTMPDDTPVAPGHSFIKTWRVRNSGDTGWGPGFALAHTAGMPMSATTRRDLPSVMPGHEVELSLPMQAPQEPGTHFSDWRLVDPQGTLFGDILYVRILVEKQPEDAAATASNGRFVADVSIPDDSAMEPGTRFTKTWRVKNSGQRTWGEGFTLNFIGGTAMTNQTSQPLPKVMPGETADISVEMWAPQTPGNYFGDWRMKDDRGAPFGEVVYVRILVPTPAGASLAAPLSQRDPLWAEKQLGLKSSDKTIGEWGCLLTCLTMMANTFGHPVSPAQLNDAMLRRRGFLEPNLTKWNALNNVYSDIVYEGKVPYSADILQRINISLARGNPVTVQVDFTRDTPYTENDQHWVLIVGRDGADYRINDPWIIPAQEGSLMERYGRTGRPMREAILSAIFYRSAQQTKPVTVDVVEEVQPTPKVAAELQTGMNLNPDAPHSNPMDSDHLKGMDWARYVFKLAARERADERDDLDKAFAQYDELLRKYDRMGVKSLIVLNQETVWGNAPWTNNQGWDTYGDQLATIAGKIASRYQRYGERVAYEIWNEGDLRDNPASVYVAPEQFAVVLNKVAAAIRSESPGSPLVFGGLATGPEEGIAYLKRCLGALGGRWPVDAIGIHPYGRWATRAPFDWAQHFGTLGEAFALYQREIGDMPFWITEIGVAADETIGPENYPAIADYMRDVYSHIGERYLHLVPVVIWFAWSDWMRNAGMVDREGQRKAHVFDAFRAVRNREL